MSSAIQPQTPALALFHRAVFGLAQTWHALPADCPPTSGPHEASLAQLGRPGLFDFANRGFVEPLRGHAQTIVADRATWHLPPADALFVQRKVSGTALLAVTLRARLPLQSMMRAALGDG